MTTTASGIVEIAGIVQRLAVLLSAGVPPAQAWGYVAGSGQSTAAPNTAPSSAAASNTAGTHAASPHARGPNKGSPNAVAARVAGALADASPIDAAIAAALDGVASVDAREASAWRGVAAAWSVASETGAPLAPTLREVAATLRDIAQVDRDISVALAGPLATSRIVMVLPVVGLLFGMALGFDTIGTLFGTPIGIVSLVVGLALILCARRWTGRLVARAQPGRVTAGLHAELVAIAVSGGGALETALETARAAISRFGIDEGEEVDAAVELSRRAGVPVAELLRSEAVEARRNARANAQLAAAALAVKLMLPLGLCILPAFLALGVVPMLVSVISSTVSGF